MCIAHTTRSRPDIVLTALIWATFCLSHAVLCTPTASNSSDNDTIRTIVVCPRHGYYNGDTTQCGRGASITGGYEFELFNRAWQGMNDVIKNNYSLAAPYPTCQTYEAILQQTAAGKCHMAFGSITAAAIGDRANLTFMGTSWSGSLIVAVKKCDKKASRLAATTPFTNHTKTIIIVVCCLIVGAWVLDYFGRWVINRWAAHQNPHPFALAALREAKGLTFFGTSLMVLVAVLTVQLLFAVFNSYLTSALLVDNPGCISSVSELQKRNETKVWTTLSYGGRAKDLGFPNIIPENPPDDQGDAWYDWLVRKSEVGGILLDDIKLNNFAKTFPSQVHLLKETVAPYSLGFFWNRHVPKELLLEFDRSVRAQWDLGFVEARAPGGKGLSTFTFGSNASTPDGFNDKFDVLEDVADFKPAFIGTLAAAGLVFVAELVVQILLEIRGQRQAAAGGHDDGAAGNAARAVGGEWPAERELTARRGWRGNR